MEEEEPPYLIGGPSHRAWLAEADRRNKSAEFGEPIRILEGHSRVFTGEPHIVQEPVRPVRIRWLCPHEGCDGEMKWTNAYWPMNPPAIHHTCTKCGFTAAASNGEVFPRIEYVPA